MNLRSVLLGILVCIQTVPTLSITSAGSQLNLHLCGNNETIAVQVLTKRDDVGSNCFCQAGPSRDPNLREDYVFTQGIGSHKLHTSAKSWNEARKICNEEGGHLAIINTLVEEKVSVVLI